MYAKFFVLALAALAVAQGPEKPCTTTVTTHATCGCGIEAHTATKLVDCHGCAAIATKTTGPVCDIVCQHKTTAPGTTTVEKCKPTKHALVRDADIKPKCTTTTTEFNACTGCTKAGHTVTASTVDCHGCETLDVAYRNQCDFACPTVKTNLASTTTVQACKKTPA